MAGVVGRVLAVLALVVATVSGQIGLVPGASAASRGAVEGRVTDHLGNPVAGVEVVLTFNRVTLPSVRTDDDGHYAFSAVKPGVHLLWSKAPHGYGPYTYYGDTVHEEDARRVHVVAGQTFTADLTLAPMGSVSGRLVDSAGRGLRDVEAYSDHPWGFFDDQEGRLGPQRSSILGGTGKGGRFTYPDVLEGRQLIRFDMVPSDLGIKTSLDNYYVYASTNVLAGGVTDLGTLHLPKFNGTIRGTVKVTNTHRGSSSAVLRDSRGHQVAAVPVDSRTGEVKFTRVPAGRYTVEVAGGTARGVVVRSGKVVRFKSVKARLSTLTGKVRSTKKSARNCVSYEDRLGHGDYHCLIGSGTFTLRGLGVGTHRIFVTSQGSGSDRYYDRTPYLNLPVTRSFLVKVAKSGSTVRKSVTIDTSGRTVTGKISSKGRGGEVVYVVLAVGGDRDHPLQQRVTKVRKDRTFTITTVGPQKGRYLFVDKFGLVVGGGKLASGTKDVRLGTLKVS